MPAGLQPRVPGTFFQREIDAWVLEEVGTSEVYRVVVDQSRHPVSPKVCRHKTGDVRCKRCRIVGAVLRCGHQITYRRSAPAGSKRTAAPCPACGSASRTTQQIAMHRHALSEAIKNAARDPGRREQLVDFLVLAMSVPSFPPADARQEIVLDTLVIAARAAGLEDSLRELDA